MNSSDVRICLEMLARAKDVGFNVELRDVITLTANRKKLPRYAEGAVIGTFATVDGVLGWLNGWCMGELYGLEETRCQRAKPALKRSKKSTKKASAQNAKSTSTRKTR